MKTVLVRLTLLLMIITLLAWFGFQNLNTPTTVRAYGGLIVDFKVPLNQPVFSVINMAPGDEQSREIDLRNNELSPRLVSIKGIQKSGLSVGLQLDNILQLVVKDGNTILYGPKTLQEFFNVSADEHGILLNVVKPYSDKTYNFIVFLPITAGNDYQNKSVDFDLKFGVIQREELLINEVYYNVASNHGLDSPADRGVSLAGLNLSIIGNGPGSINKIFVDIENDCTIFQVNKNLSKIIKSSDKSYKNSAKINLLQKSIDTDSHPIIDSIKKIGNTHQGACINIQKENRNHEWVELFNPTDKVINLKNYTLSDNSLISATLPNTKIMPNQFVLITKDSSTWKFWNVPSKAKKINLGKQIGDGLNDTGDHLILNNASGTEIDRMSWGLDTSGYTPTATNPIVPAGSSTGRQTTYLDTDSAADWQLQNPPSPGM